MDSSQEEFNDRYRSYFKEYLHHLECELYSRIRKGLYPELNIRNIDPIGPKRFSIDKEINEYFGDSCFQREKIQDYINLYYTNNMDQIIRISFYQPEYLEKIFMNIQFEYDDYSASHQIDQYPGEKNEYMSQCFETFRKLAELWINEVIYKFNEALGVDAEFEWVSDTRSNKEHDHGQR